MLIAELYVLRFLGLIDEPARLGLESGTVREFRYATGRPGGTLSLAFPDPQKISVYHVFLASPNDRAEERQVVRRFFDRFNRDTALPLWSVRLEVVDWEHYVSYGIGRPQALITAQTLERFRGSLVLFIGILAQRFGSPTGAAESGTEEEFNWALECASQSGIPEIKFFFQGIEQPAGYEESVDAQAALDQRRRVSAFRSRIEAEKRVFVAEYGARFRDVFEEDLARWLLSPQRPWAQPGAQAPGKPNGAPDSALDLPSTYFECLQREFHRLDIVGIDNDRAFEIPLSEIYVRLRVTLDEAPDSGNDAGDADAIDGETFDIQSALHRFRRLVIAGDAGAGKSTFQRFIALTIAQCMLSKDAASARQRLSLPAPLPLPIFVSCWALSSELVRLGECSFDKFLQVIAAQLSAMDCPMSIDGLRQVLSEGRACLLFDALDEVPTDAGRMIVSRLIEECVARYGKNRFVVTARIRAYTGDAILRSGFVRCDIQPFDAADRAHFLKNWVALLRGPDAHLELEKLTAAVEGSERIRQLAATPLLLTVLAIVHWNNKRLPEQRVELYEECIDVLIGQRKAAEHVRLDRPCDALDPQAEQHKFEERAWTRKRFAEIALFMLARQRERGEVSRNDLVELLAPRFLDRGAADREQAESQARWFLSRQEVLSGLLICRGDRTRFVHLAFMEFLAAWQLSGMEFEQVAATIEPYLRTAEWFECLQQLGGLWAKESDENFDLYIGWVLDRVGNSIGERAPVIALCANIVQDAEGVATLSASTRDRLNRAVEGTLAAFSAKSKVPERTQLEILEALGRLGAAVKPHLLAATAARRNAVRRRAIQIVLPHLSDDELFRLRHILDDASREPIATYLTALIDRDRERALRMLDETALPCRATDGILQLSDRLLQKHDDLSKRLLIHRVECPSFGGSGTTMRLNGLRRLAEEWWDEETEQVLKGLAIDPSDGRVRQHAVERLIARSGGPVVRAYLTSIGTQNEDCVELAGAILSLMAHWPDDETWSVVSKALAANAGGFSDVILLEAPKYWSDERTRQLLIEYGMSRVDGRARLSVLRMLLEHWPDDVTRSELERVSREDLEPSTRSWVRRALAEKWPERSEVHSAGAGSA